MAASKNLHFTMAPLRHLVKTSLDPPEIERFKQAQSACFRFGVFVVTSFLNEGVHWLTPRFCACSVFERI